MMRFGVLTLAAALLLVTAFCAFGMKEQARPLPPPDYAVGRLSAAGPFVIFQAGDTTWVQVHANDTYCPGDPSGGHGGEADGGPGATENWCFEGNWPAGDSCGTNPPWNAPPNCIEHLDVRALSSQTGVNYWHVDSYRCDERTYCGDSALWCGSDTMWYGSPVECGTWINPPGYGDQWNCVAQLTLPGTFDVVNGCTLYFDPRYDLECKYDYFYVEMYDGTQWVELALFNATSNNPGSECGTPTGGNPDYWGNTDSFRLLNVDWQTRAVSGEPAFKAEIAPGSYSYTSGPRFRWRFESDGAWSDADGRGNTDGAAYVDNVWIHGDDEQYVMDFETGLDAYWSFPDPEGVIDQWHMEHDPDPPYEGGDGGERSTCELDSSVVYRGRPSGGYASGTAWRNGWFYRLVSPVIPVQNSGAVVQYDQFMCGRAITCDYTDTKVRFYDTNDNTWCPWINIDGFILYGGCFFWNFNRNENVTPFYGVSDDSMQFCWDLMDVSSSGDFCRGKHGGTENIVDNVSIGFFEGNTTVFRTRVIDILQDMFFTDLCFYNSFFDAYDQDTLNYYADEAHPYPAGTRLNVEVTDKDGVQAVELIGSIDGGATWQSVAMDFFEAFDPQDSSLGGTYVGTLCMSDFGLTDWAAGTELWYYVKCTDVLNNEVYFPNEADPGDPDHTGTVEDYFEASVLPMYPAEFDGIKILLVDGYGRRNYDYTPCFAVDDSLTALENMYEQSLVDAGYCYDKYDITGGGSNIHVHYLCTWNTDYDAVLWFTGPYFSNYLFDKEAQVEMRNYLLGGGKVILCGDRTAYSAASEDEGGGGEDSLGGEFLSGIMGCDYLSEMASPFTYPYVYAKGVSSVQVFGTPTPVDFDTILVYRECPYLKEMSWVKVEAAPPDGYVAQVLVDVLNPMVADADLVTYVEYQGIGQSVLINFDLSGSINQTYQYCDGTVPEGGYQSFTPGNYEGRADLIRMILNDIFGLPSQGTGGTTGAPGRTVFKWALHQNAPNPVSSMTEVRYEVARPGAVSIKVYNAQGQLVNTLVDGRMEPGRYSAHWDGKNLAGEKVASGVYFYKLEAGAFKTTRKMLVVN
jgi:hypothetical protein